MEKIKNLNIFHNLKSKLQGIKNISKTNTLSTCGVTNPLQNNVSVQSSAILPQITVSRVQMTPNEVQMYNAITSVFANENTNGDIPTNKKLDELLKSGKLLDSNSNDKSTTLQNIYNILTKPRFNNISSAKIAQQTINMIYKPSVGTQKFGDIPKELEGAILNNVNIDPQVRENPELMDVKNNGSGTCPVGSLASNMAHRLPSEYARWVSELSSSNMCVKQNIKLSSLSHNPLDAIKLLKTFNTDYKLDSFKNAELTIKPDKNAALRASIQADYYDPGERSIVDVLLQSTLMNLGSEQTYDSLTDTTKSSINPNTQGLIEYQKTFVESIVKNKEMLSIVYQNIDDNQKLLGYRCDLGKIEQHITQTIDEGEDVIIGYVATDETNTILGGHEITIVDYKQDKNGKTVFVCNDTDDNNDNYIEYNADWLLPKIHHAGYPAHIVENEKELLYAS